MYPLYVVSSSMLEGIERHFSQLHVTTMNTQYNQHIEEKGLFPIKVVEVLAYERELFLNFVFQMT